MCESYQTSLTSTLQVSYKIVRFAGAHKTAKLSPAAQEMFDLVTAQSALNAQIVMRTDQECATISAELYHWYLALLTARYYISGTLSLVPDTLYLARKSLKTSFLAFTDTVMPKTHRCDGRIGGLFCQIKNDTNNH